MTLRSIIYLGLFAHAYSMACGSEFFLPTQETTNSQNNQYTHHRTASGHMQEYTSYTPRTPIGMEVAASTAKNPETATQIIAATSTLQQEPETTPAQSK